MAIKSLKKNLLATASVAALAAFASQAAHAANITRGDGGTTAIPANNDTGQFTGSADDVTGILSIDTSSVTSVGIIKSDNEDAGLLKIDGAGTLTFTSTIGVDGDNEIGKIDINGASTVNFNGDIAAEAIAIKAAATLVFADGTDIGVKSNGNIDDTLDSTYTALTTSVDNQGTLTFGGTSKVFATIGANGTEVGTININGTSKTVTFGSNVYTNALNFGGDTAITIDGSGAQTFNSDTAITFTASNTGTINIISDSGNITFDAAVGSSTSNRAKLIALSGNANKIVATSDIYTKGLSFTGAATTLELSDGADLNVGDGITAAADGAGVIRTLGDTTFTGQIGAENFDLDEIQLGGASKTVTFNNDVYVNDATNGIRFTADGSAVFANGADILGSGASLSTATNGTGTVTFNGSHTVAGNVGAGGNELKAINLGGTGTVAFGGSVDAAAMTFTADGKITIADGKNFQNDAQSGTVKASTANTGTITFLGATTTAADLGESAKLLKAINIIAGSGSADTKTVTLGSVYATNVVLGDHVDDVITLAIADGKTLKSTVSTYANGDGTLNFVGGGTLDGNVGSATKKLALVQVDSGAANNKTLTVASGDIYATEVKFAGTGGKILLADGSDITANITTANANQGTVEIDGSSVFDGTIGVTGTRVGTIDIDSGATSTVTFKGDAFTKAFDASGATAGAKIAIAQGKTVTITDAGTYGSATYQFGVKEVDGLATDAGDTVGRISSAGAVNFTNAKVDILIDNTGGYIAADNYYKIASGSASTLPTELNATDNSYTVKFTVVQGNDAKIGGSANDLYVLASRENTFGKSASGLENVSSIGAALERIGNTGPAAMDAIVGALEAKATASEVAEALKTLNPNVSGSITAASAAAADASIGVVQNRMEVASNAASSNVVATGSSAYNSGVWGEVFGSTADQDVRGGVRGYQADTLGFAIGADTKIDDMTVVGASIAYANTEADAAASNTVADGTTEIDSYQGNLYAVRDYGKWYGDALAGFTYNRYDTTRNIFTGGQATADFDGQQYTARVGGGYKVDLQGGVKLTPIAGLKYTYLTVDKYTESGAGALTVDNDDIQSLKSDLGFKVNYPVIDGSVTYTPEFRAAWIYDFIGDEQQATSFFNGIGGTQFTSKGADVAKNAFNLGVGLAIMAQDNVTVSFDYDWTTKEDYDNHAGSLKARFAF